MAVTVFEMAIGTVLLLAGTAKLPSPIKFTLSIIEYRIVPTAAAAPLSWIVILLEVLAGTLLFLALYLPHPLVIGANVIAAVLFACFGAAMGVNLHRGRIIPCGCGTSGIGRDNDIGWLRAGTSLIIAGAIFALSLFPTSVPMSIGLSGIFLIMAVLLSVTLMRVSLSVWRSGISRKTQKILVERARKLSEPQETIVDIRIY